ncbi:MAG: sulfatase [Phycisphaeraceae bacterium]|nr:sulfatase [Phycisphaeraceae bacterium]
MLILIALLFCMSAAAADKPNIVLIISDDHSFTDYGFMGHDVIQTPNLDKLATQSVLFRRGYVPTALCRPALMTLATGTYAHHNLITGNDPANTDANKAHVADKDKSAKAQLIDNIDRFETLPQTLAKQGYLSHQSGKWWEGSYQRGGFTHGMTRGYPKPKGRHGDDGLDIGREGLGPILNFMDEAIEKDKPFFLWYAPFLPHTPHNPPDRLLNKYKKEGRHNSIAKYYAMVDWFDETCGQLLQGLEDKGVYGNTLVIYVTDNGWIQREGGGYAPRSKRSPNEGGTRTPIMYRWPGKIDPNDRPELATSIDIYPTILAAAGAGIPDDRPGLNILPHLTDDKAIERDHIFGESFAHDIADIYNPEASLLYRWVIKGNMKLLLTYDGNPGRMKYPPKDFAPQLYDLQQDPLEKNNLAKDLPGKVKSMTALLNGWYQPKQTKHSGNDKP